MNALQNALNAFDNLDLEEKSVFLSIIEKLKIEFRRDEILRNANKTLNSINNGTAKFGNLDTLLKDLEDLRIKNQKLINPINPIIPKNPSSDKYWQLINRFEVLRPLEGFQINQSAKSV